VAPCPDGSDCVSTGVIRWQGQWRLDTGVIAIEIETIPGEKGPEQPPGDFLVLNDEPISIGARRDKLVCPFKKRK
jgi:hypothetical protein